MNNSINIPEYEVSEFNKVFKDIIEEKFNYVRIKGEISELKTATKGQIYLTLKDDNSILSGVIWEQKIKYLDILPEVGLEVITTGKITTWSRYKTSYQIDIDKIEIAGEGALLKLIEERKKRLQKKGYFDEDRKKILPFLPTKIGVITSPTGSVIHDIINRVNDRFPISIDLWPVSVQGLNAVKEINEAIIGFNESISEKPDVIIIARGGGSTEDLMVFNDEKLARSVYESKIPIVTAIGHETDTTILDLVSDLRASTPTAAAEKIVPVKKDIINKLLDLNLRLDKLVLKSLNTFQNNFEYLNRFLKAPNSIIEFYENKLNSVIKDLNIFIKNLIELKVLNLKNFNKTLKAPVEKIKNETIKLNDLNKNLKSLINEKYEINYQKFKSNLRLLNSNSVTNNLKKGYSVVMKEDKIIKNKNLIKKEDRLKIKFFDGDILINIKKSN